MAQIHQWRKMHFSALIPCFGNYFRFVSDFRQIPCRYFLKFFPFFLHCCLLHPVFWRLEASELTSVFVPNCNGLAKLFLLQQFWSLWYLSGTPSNRILTDSSASTMQENLVLLFPISRQFSPRQFTGVITLSLNWSMPYQGGCSQVLISSRCFDSSICDWKNKFSLFGKYHLFRIESVRVDFRCVHRLQLLKVCNQYVTLPNSHRVQSVSKEQYQVRLVFPNWRILDWSFAEIGWYSTDEPNGIIGPLSGCPKRLSQGVFPSENKSVTFRR